MWTSSSAIWTRALDVVINYFYAVVVHKLLWTWTACLSTIRKNSTPENYAKTKCKQIISGGKIVFTIYTFTIEQKKGFLSHVLIIAKILFCQIPYTLLHFVIQWFLVSFVLCKDNSYVKIVWFLFSITLTKVWNTIVLKCVCITSKYMREVEKQRCLAHAHVHQRCCFIWVNEDDDRNW